MQAAQRPRFGNASEVVEDTPTLTDVVIHGAVTLILPWPPTGNHAVTHTRAGGHFRTATYNDYRAQVAHIARQRRAQPIRGRVHVSALFWPPDRRARDIDNAWKSLGDSLQAAGVFENDSLIDRLELVRMHQRDGGEVCVTVKAAA
jgi:crossover junction endodeoxyribonuclease RusA